MKNLKLLAFSVIQTLLILYIIPYLFTAPSMLLGIIGFLVLWVDIFWICWLAYVVTARRDGHNG